MTIKVTKNGMDRSGKQKYAVKAYSGSREAGKHLSIFTNCDSKRVANALKRNVETLIATLTTVTGS